MTGRVLVVDDLEPNLRLLEAKLKREYFDVCTANRGHLALERARHFQPDIVLLDVLMPGLNGFETCKMFKRDPRLAHIPIVMVTALDRREDRIAGLEAGADDFLTKPIDDVMLMSRVRSLIRIKGMIDELRQRHESGTRLGAIDEEPLQQAHALGANVLIVEHTQRLGQRLAQLLEKEQTPLVYQAALPEDLARPADVVVAGISGDGFDGLRVIAHLRSSPQTRNVPILAIINRDELDRGARALELGANDLIVRPLDGQELQARVRTLVRRKRYAEALRHSLDAGLEAAITDQLTGLNNRRYLLSQLEPLLARAARGGDTIGFILIDIDHFKAINDTFGHDAGDEALRQFAARLACNFRPLDVTCRWGGEEFAVLMPNTILAEALVASERLRKMIHAAPFRVAPHLAPWPITASVGVAVSRGPEETVETLLKRADEGLYRAKADGRNLVRIVA